MATKFEKASNRSVKFSPYALSKLCWFRDREDVEVMCLGELADVNDPDHLLVVDVHFLPQDNDQGSCDFRMEDYADWLGEQVAENGRTQEEMTSIWIHTHPGDGVTPSGKDNAMLDEKYSRGLWTMMVILGKDGSLHQEYAFRVGQRYVRHALPKANIYNQVDWVDGLSYSPAAPDLNAEQYRELWEAEFQLAINIKPPEEPQQVDVTGMESHDPSVVVTPEVIIADTTTDAALRHFANRLEPAVMGFTILEPDEYARGLILTMWRLLARKKVSFTPLILGAEPVDVPTEKGSNADGVYLLPEGPTTPTGPVRTGESPGSSAGTKVGRKFSRKERRARRRQRQSGN